MYTKMRSIKIIALFSVLIIFVSTISVFAAFEPQVMNLTKYASNDSLIEMVSEYGTVNGKDVKAFKLSEEEKKMTLETTGGTNLENSEVYIIERKMSSGETEASVIADVAVPTSSGGESSETKDGRVTITCVLGYERLTYNNISYVKGTYYGGKVEKQQSLTSVKSVEGLYTDSGAYITISGDMGISAPFKDSTVFDLSKHTTLQTKSLNRDKYFNTNMTGVSMVAAKYTAKFTSSLDSGNTYTISVNAYAYS